MSLLRRGAFGCRQKPSGDSFSTPKLKIPYQDSELSQISFLIKHKNGSKKNSSGIKIYIIAYVYEHTFLNFWVRF